MRNEAFVDINIIIDFLVKRQPFDEAASRLFNEANLGNVILYVSANVFPYLFYLLSKLLQSKNQAFDVLRKFRQLVNVLPVDAKSIDLALQSDFKDLEDAVVYFVAEQHKIPNFLTRNEKDFRTAKMQVMSAGEFLQALNKK